MAEKVLAPETRTVTSPIEMREESGVPKLGGYAATFNQLYDLGPFREKIDPAAFTRTGIPRLGETAPAGSLPDVRLLIDHEGQPLARTKSGTLRLYTDDIGLRVEADLDPTDPDVQRLAPKMRRGDLDQMSFAFRVPAGGDAWSDDYSERTLREINLQGGDVSVVTYPANPATSVSMRALDLVAAKTVFVETMMREARAGKAISADNMSKLQAVLASLAEVDAHLDAADVGLDAAMSTLADDLGVTNPDPADPDDMGQANSGRPLGLALAVARRLGI